MRDFQFLLKRVGIKCSDTEMKAWFASCAEDGAGAVPLDELAYLMAVKRFFPDDEVQYHGVLQSKIAMYVHLYRMHR
eukprot:m.1648922 g.1648922  ORF g.1648922 m.1648922 type:complete len:77 (+) comp81297_c0_seq1:299-529(+)